MSARIAVIGAGAIGRPVIEAIAAGTVEGAELVAVVNELPVAELPAPLVSLADALELCDVVVECAGQDVIARHGLEILTRGCDLLVTSVGALSDRVLFEALRNAGPGRMLATSGAIGGIDLLASAAAHGPITSASVTTRKLPVAVLQPWMDEATLDRVRTTQQPVEVFRGSAIEAARLFPRSLNVAATVGIAIDDLDLVEVRLVADPAAKLTSHVIEAAGAAGTYRFDISNRPSAANPSTSGVVAQAVLRTLSMLIGRPARIV